MDHSIDKKNVISNHKKHNVFKIKIKLIIKNLMKDANFPKYRP